MGVVALEFVILWRQGRAYSWKEGAISLAIGIGWLDRWLQHRSKLRQSGKPSG